MERQENMSEIFEIASSKLTYRDLDMDFLVRFQKSGEAERVVSARVLKEELDQIGSHFFVTFYNRAYKSGKDTTVCKLRSGVKVEFVLR